MKLLENLLRSCVKRGKLRLWYSDGTMSEFGSGENGPRVAVKLHDRKLSWQILINPELAVAEAYMDGRMTLEEDTSLVDMIDLFFINPAPVGIYPFQEALSRVAAKLQKISASLPINTTKRQVRHHYDLSGDLYRLFLDDGLNYSCAFYESPDDSLEKAQKAKLDHVVAKLDLKPGMKVLEIGGGWGSLALHMGKAGADVTSLNVSGEQIAVAEKRVAEAGLSDRVRFVNQDYREFEGKFDRVVSVGMMEHVGPGNLPVYFAKVKECLKPNGHAVIHSITRMGPPGATGPFLLKYIFPGGYCPALSEVMSAVEDQGLWMCDAEGLRLHYYYTLKAWRERFVENWDAARELYDERFCRMWEFYLAGCEISFLHGINMVTQLILSSEIEAVPLRRDFIQDNERRITSEEDAQSSLRAV